MHFAGGDTQYLMQLLLGYLNKYKDTLSSIHYGADVTTFTKSSTAVIQQNQSDYLRTLVNNGVSMMNFFGHAAGIGFDISIDNPEDYSNYKRYYFILANSCFAGDLFESAINSSEAFVLINNKGAIGFLGAVKSSSITSLHKYSSELIGRIAKRNYNKPIGYIIKKTIETLQSSASDDLRSLCFGMTLHGDPVLKLSVAEKPDFMLTQECISFTPSDISSELDSFAVNIAVYNLGKSIQDSVVLELTRTSPDNTEEKYIKLIPSPEYCDTITFRLPLNSTSGAGMNTFHAFIDAYAMVDESEENNNTTTTNLFISSNEVNPIYPYEYQVLPDTFITLIASSGYAMAPVSNYIFQIDTTDAFNSPFLKQSNPISKTGGIIEWSLPFTMLDMPDSTVYYWRVRSEKSENWGESSFQFIKGKRGWGQAHFFQFKKDKYNYVSYNKPARKFEFINIYQNISAQTGIMPYIQWEEEWYKINNIIFGQTSCAGMTNAIKFAVFDTIGVSPWENFDPDGDNFGTFGSLKCKPYPLFYFDFITNNEPWFSRIESLIDSVPNGYYVLAFSHLNHNAENYPESLYQAFESIGSNVIRTLPNNVPYIIFGRKGHYNMADERVGNSVSQIISGSWDIKTNWREGYIESTQIGPASSWGSLHWRVKSYEQGVWTDSVRLSVIGIKHNGTEDTVIRNLPPIPDSLDIYNLFSRIDASVYPYLRLHLKMSDDSLRTPAQLERWQVLYEPVPETAIDPSAYFSFYNANLKEGETARIAIATRNIGPVDFPDSLMVSYMLVDDNKKVHNLKTKKTRLHPVKDILIDSISFSTRGFAGTIVCGLNLILLIAKQVSMTS